jgi:hypothetical protein
MTKSFPKKQSFKPYSKSTLSVKIRPPEWETELSGFCDFGFLPDFIPSWSLGAFLPLFLLQNTLDLEISQFSSCPIHVLKLPKLDCPE